MVRQNLWKCLLKKESFELGFEVGEGGEILQAGRQWIPDSWGNDTERTVTNRFEIAQKGCDSSLNTECCGLCKSNKYESETPVYMHRHQEHLIEVKITSHHWTA